MALSPTGYNTRKVVVYVLVALFGIASWVDINGLWVELPILVHALPEGWSLPSYLIAVCQFANIGPLLYTLASVNCPNRVSEKGTIYCILATGVIAMVLLVFFWDRTSLIGGVPHSSAMLTLSFFLALVDTTSSVAFLPFMAVFKPMYMPAYFIGEGFSGLLPGLLGLAQGAGRTVCLNTTHVANATLNATSHSLQVTSVESNFSIEIFFMFIAGMIIVSGIAFTLLKYHPYCKSEYQCINASASAKINGNRKWRPENNQLLELVDKEPCFANGVDSADNLKEAIVGTSVAEGHAYPEEEHAQVSKMTRNNYIVALLLTGWTSALTNAVLISVQSYSCLPYGTKPYQLTVTLANVANPLSCFVLFFYCVTSIRVLTVLSLIGSLLGTYIMAAAAMSPHPVLVGTSAGSVIIVSVWVMCIFILTYSKVAFTALFRLEGKTGLLYCGAISQLGPFVGGVLMFQLVNVLHLFVMVPSCTQH